MDQLMDGAWDIDTDEIDASEIDDFPTYFAISITIFMTNRPTDQPTNGWTYSHIDMR